MFQTIESHKGFDLFFAYGKCFSQTRLVEKILGAGRGLLLDRPTELSNRPRPLLSMHPGSLEFELPEVLILRFNNDVVFFHGPPEPDRRRRLPSTAKHEKRHRDDGLTPHG